MALLSPLAGLGNKVMKRKNVRDKDLERSHYGAKNEDEEDDDDSKHKDTIGYRQYLLGMVFLFLLQICCMGAISLFVHSGEHDNHTVLPAASPKTVNDSPILHRIH